MGSFNAVRFNARALAIRVAVIVGVHALYAVVFALQHPVVGDAIGSLSIVPTAIMGWLLGLRLGIVGGFLNFLLNETLYGVFSDTVDTFSLQSVPGLFFSVGSSAFVGWLSDLLRRTRMQARTITEQRETLQLEVEHRRQAEETALQARDQAFAASQVKSRILASVSHEIRTPLTAIVGYAEMLYEGELGKLNEKQQRAVGRLTESAIYLNQLVNGLLDEAEFTARGVELDLLPINVPELVEQIYTRMNILAEAKGLELRTEIDPKMPDNVVGDQRRIQQIIINLVGNGIKFTEEGGVSLRIYPLHQNSWIIEVADTGTGIAPEAQEHIFEAFHRAKNADHLKRSGAGLGLSIVKHLTEAMEGEIMLESKVGEGSTFTIRLPLTPVGA